MASHALPKLVSCCRAPASWEESFCLCLRRFSPLSQLSLLFKEVHKPQEQPHPICIKGKCVVALAAPPLGIPVLSDSSMAPLLHYLHWKKKINLKLIVTPSAVLKGQAGRGQQHCWLGGTPAWDLQPEGVRDATLAPATFLVPPEALMRQGWLWRPCLEVCPTSAP